MNQTETLDKVKAAFAEYQERVEAILTDYMVNSDGLNTELAAADEYFLGDVADLDEKQSFDDLIDMALDMPKKSNDDLLKRMDPDDIVRYLDLNHGYLLIKVDGMEDRQKLEDFIKQNIYPYNINELWTL